MGLQETKIESLPFVTAELNYLAPTAGKPRTYAYDPPPGEPKTTALPEPHQVPIFDARLIADAISLDREGFALVRHPTVVKNFYDDKEVRSVYYPAAEAPRMCVALARGNRQRASMSTRPKYRAPTAFVSICPMKPTSFSGDGCRSSTCGGQSADRCGTRRSRCATVKASHPVISLHPI